MTFATFFKRRGRKDDNETLMGAQLLSYLKLTGLPAGLLINFQVPHLENGIKRLVNNL